MHPDKHLTTTSMYSYEQICECIDRWYAVEDALREALSHYDELPVDLNNMVNDLVPINVPMDGKWRRVGSTERYPVQKWNKIIKHHEKVVAILNQHREEVQYV